MHFIIFRIMEQSPTPPPDGVRAWLAATGETPSPAPAPAGEEGHHRPASRRLLAGTVGMVVVAVVLAGARLAQILPGTAEAPPPAAATLPPATPAAPSTPAVASSPAASVGVQGVPPHLEAAALVALRTALGRNRYVDTAAVERAEARGALQIVTVLAVVLDREGDRWGPPNVRRYAVPMVGTFEQPLAAGPPWLLPATPANAQPPAWSDQSNAAVAAASVHALRAAGYRRLELLGVRTSADVPGVTAATVRAVAPGEKHLVRHEVWLTAGGTRVLGLGAGGPDGDVPVPPVAPVALEQP